MDYKSLKVVPWFSTEEWDNVCKLVYSDDVNEQKKGYEQLLVWKARVPALPASVTCTLELLQVHLQDQALWPRIASGEVPPYAVQELRLSYSTVIMRFLNHLASLFQNTQNQTLYSVAKKLHIPVWVVDIRHDAAHNSSLPSVDVLRVAAGYALNWLYEYWWKPEALSLSDWKSAEDGIYDDTSHIELCNLLDLWQALNLYQESDYTTVDQIPDKEVSTQVALLRSKVQSNTSSNEPTPESDIEITVDHNCIRGMSVHEASSLVLRYFKKFVGTISSERVGDDILLNSLVGEGMFHPSLLSDEDWLHVESNKLPPRSLKMWEPVLACLPLSVILRLLQRLLKLTSNVNGVVSNQSRLAALWINELATAVVKLHQVLNLVEELSATARNGTEPTKLVKLAKGISINLVHDDELTKLTLKSLCKKLVAHVETECPELEDVLTLGIKVLPKKKETYEVVKFAVLNPSQLTPIFLPSLLKLIGLPTSADIHSNMMMLVELYTQFTNTSVEVDVDTPVFTLTDLMSSSAKLEVSAAGEKTNPLPKHSAVESMEVEDRDQHNTFNTSQKQKNVSNSRWCIAEANCEWSKCPLGVLPWQRGQIWVKLAIPECTWKLSGEMELENFSRLPQLLNKVIEWEDVKRRRLKKKRNPELSKKIVQTAVETVLHKTV